MFNKQVLCNRKPFVLVTNDDGIESPGLHALVEALKPMADLLIAAPETEVRVTRQAYMNYGKYVKPLKRSFEEGYNLEWELNDKLHEVPEDTDIYAVYFDRVISVTPMSSLMYVDVKNYYK